MDETVELQMPFDNQYHAVLSIPVDTCQIFSLRPLAWLRYVGFTIYGNEGHISRFPDGQPVDYNLAIKPTTYYYVSQEPHLLDPNLMDHRTTDSSATESTHRGYFRELVTERDQTCIMTGAGDEVFAQACHIIPHAKGSEYITNLVTHRQEVVNPTLNDINDTRNGLLLAQMIHSAFGESQAAFLQTPNFAMTIHDVELDVTVKEYDGRKHTFAIQPGFGPHAEIRLTFQHFETNEYLAVLAPHNSDARISDSDEWPPSLLFNITYGCAALKTWAAPLFLSFARQLTVNIYYNDSSDESSDNNGGNGRDQGGRGQGGGRGSRGRGSGGRRGGRRGGSGGEASDARLGVETRAQKRARQAKNTTPDVADIILALWTRNARKVQHQEHPAKAATQEKVQAWLGSLDM